METMTEVDYTDDIALLTSIPAPARLLPHRQELATSGTGLYVNAKAQSSCVLNKTAPSSH